MIDGHMSLKLWHDDIRRPPSNDWNWARTNAEAKELLLRQPYDEISMDHDLGLHKADPDVPDADIQVLPDGMIPEEGWELAKWMVETGNVPPKITIHSWNPIGALRMKLIFTDAGYPAETKRFLR